jgi:hypothetical protein
MLGSQLCKVQLAIVQHGLLLLILYDSCADVASLQAMLWSYYG